MKNIDKLILLVLFIIYDEQDEDPDDVQVKQEESHVSQWLLDELP